MADRRRLLVLGLLLAAVVSIAPLASAHADAAPGPSPRITGAQYWHLDDICRGESDPAVSGPACRKRDRALRSLGMQQVRAFHRAWRHGDRRAVRRVVVHDYHLPFFRGRATGRRECSYDAGTPSVFCWIKPRGRGWIGVSFQVTRYERPALPRWQVVSAVPDA